jgi:beta-glucosidase
MVVAFMGYMDGFFPPNERREEKAVRPVVKQLVQMHLAAHAALKADAKRRNATNQVGIAQHLRTFMPWSNASLLDRVTAWGIDRKFVLEFLDKTASTSDYVGINYYGRYYVKATGIGKFQTFSRDESEPGEERSDLGWAADHEGMEKALLRCAQRYGKPIYVLENGMADKDDDDARRRRFLIGQTQAIWRAIERGADVRGYMHWALTDNFEWAEGFGPRFGLVKVDYGDDFKRTPRKSAELFSRIAQTNTISADDWSREG